MSLRVVHGGGLVRGAERERAVVAKKWKCTVNGGVPGRLDWAGTGCSVDTAVWHTDWGRAAGRTSLWDLGRTGALVKSLGSCWAPEGIMVVSARSWVANEGGKYFVLVGKVFVWHLKTTHLHLNLLTDSLIYLLFIFNLHNSPRTLKWICCCSVTVFSTCCIHAVCLAIVGQLWPELRYRCARDVYRQFLVLFVMMCSVCVCVSLRVCGGRFCGWELTPGCSSAPSCSTSLDSNTTTSTRCSGWDLIHLHALSRCVVLNQA